MLAAMKQMVKPKKQSFFGVGRFRIDLSRTWVVIPLSATSN